MRLLNQCSRISFRNWATPNVNSATLNFLLTLLFLPVELVVMTRWGYFVELILVCID